MGDKNCSQSLNTTRDIISEIKVSVINITTKNFVTKESAETLAADIDIQKLVLIMQETANVTGRKSLHTNTKSQKVVTKNMLENEVK